MLTGKPSALGFIESDHAQRDQKAMRHQAHHEGLRDDAERVRHVQRGTYGRYVEEALKRAYHPDTFNAMRARLRLSNNVLKDIVSKLAVAWSEGASYALVQADGAPYDDADGAFAAFLQQAKLDQLVAHLDELTWLHPRVAVGPTVVEQERTGLRALRWAIHTPETFTLAEDDDAPGEWESLTTYGECDDERGVCRACKTTWTSDMVTTYVRRDTRWEVLSQQENPYRTIPFVLFPASSSSESAWLPCVGPMLADVTIETACWETFLSYVGAGQVKVLAAELKGFPQGQVLRHAGAIDLGGSGAPSVLDFQSDINGLANVYIRRLRQQAAIAVGLGGDEFELSGQPPSGEALKMRYWARDRLALQKRASLKTALVELFWMSQHVLAYQLQATVDDDGNPAAPIAGITATVPYDPATFDTKGLRLAIDVNEITYPELAAERSQREDRDLELGLTNPVELYMRRNPDVSADEAKAAVLANKALTAALADGSALRRTAPGMLRALMRPGGE